jgi:hypothetical protein
MSPLCAIQGADDPRESGVMDITAGVAYPLGARRSRLAVPRTTRRPGARHEEATMASFPFPFPCTIDLGFANLDVGNNCLVLKRKDREYPHATFHYRQKPGCAYWWPHIRWSPKKRPTPLGEIRAEDAEAFMRRFDDVIAGSFERLYRPTTLADLGDDGWRLAEASDDLLEAWVDITRVGTRTLAVESLAENPAGVLEFLRLVRRRAVDPRKLIGSRPSSKLLYAVRGPLKKLEQTLACWRDPGKDSLDWYLADFGKFRPGTILGVQPDDLFRDIAPELLHALDRIAEALELPVKPARGKARSPRAATGGPPRRRQPPRHPEPRASTGSLAVRSGPRGPSAASQKRMST